MRKINITICLLVVSATVILFSCNNNPTNSEIKDKDTTPVAETKQDSPAMPAYDPAMDPLTTGGKLVKKLSDTLGVKMYEFTVKPGESWGVHKHPSHTVYVLQGGKMALYMGVAGKVDTLTFPTGMSIVSGPLTDSGKNIGKTTIKMLVTDIYRP
jgi:hypothetical protein